VKKNFLARRLQFLIIKGPSQLGQAPRARLLYILIKKDFEATLKNNTSLKAIIEKTQLRLMESNKQSVELSVLLNKIMVSINEGETAIKDVKKLVSIASKKITLLVNSNLD